MAAAVELREATETELRALARQAARMILDGQKYGLPADPRHPAFASEYIMECDKLLAATPVLLQGAIESAGHAAEGTNVDRFQGLIEVVQNAEDREATQVRMMLRKSSSTRQLLIVHNGAPVEYEHLLAMMLPFVSTKRDDADLRGRFGIGLKTLRRICTDIQVHGSPYHFGSGPGVSIVERQPERAIPDFYHPTIDTLLVLDVERDFEPEALERWFHEWRDDGLLFLDHVRRFQLDRRARAPLIKQTDATAWQPVSCDGRRITKFERRSMRAGSRDYVIYRAQLPVPKGLLRFHKKTSLMTTVSVATCCETETAGVFVGFRTRIPTSMPFAVDAQFDPTASRENIQENPWNEWLLAKLGEVLAQAAATLMQAQPKKAWWLVPLEGEGLDSHAWPADNFLSSLTAARERFSSLARVGAGKDAARLSKIVYESYELASIISGDDLTQLAPQHVAMRRTHRDGSLRWRRVLDAIGRSRVLNAYDVLNALDEPVFATKAPKWWVTAAASLTSHCERDAIMGKPLWLLDDGKRTAAHGANTTRRKLVFGNELPQLSTRYALFDVLHPAFASETGKSATDWLVREAAFTAQVDAQDELLAFAEAFAENPQRVSEDELREFRNLLDPISSNSAAYIGVQLGQALLVEAMEGSAKGKRSWQRPSELYLPKAIDRDNPNWPNAAAGLAGIYWITPAYDERLRTGLGKQRKTAEGIRSRGARNFLTLLGAATGPRIVVGAPPSILSSRRLASMRGVGATSIANDGLSPDLDLVLNAITDKKRPKKDRRERAIALMKALSRDWSKGLDDEATVEGRHVARKYIYSRGTHVATWAERLMDTEWVPVSRDRFRRPGDTVIKSFETQAMFGADDFIAGISVGELDSDFAAFFELASRVHASDVLMMLEQMRDGHIDFDSQKVRSAYQHLSRLAPRKSWLSTIDDVSVADVKRRFAAKQGLVLVSNNENAGEWRRPVEVRQGQRIIPQDALYVLDRDAYRPLWEALSVQATTLEDCCEYLKVHADIAPPVQDDGVLIQIYRYMSTLLTMPNVAGRQSVRYVPLACGEDWRAKRPILLVEDIELREKLAVARPNLFFWRPPCDTRTLEPLIEALGVTRIEPEVRPVPNAKASEDGDDLAMTFRSAVDHLSNTLGKSDPAARLALSISWSALKSLKLYVYDEYVPVDVHDPALGSVVQTQVHARISREPLELHVSTDGLERREEAGRAIASLFDAKILYPFDGEWVLAWQAAERSAASAIQFAVDDEAHAAAVKDVAAQIATKAGAEVKIRPKKDAASPGGRPSPPLRELKELQAGVSSVTVVEGKAPANPKRPIKPNLKKRKRAGKTDDHQRVANTDYTAAQLEDFGWDVLSQVLAHASGKDLEDFRARHGVGADGVFNWEQFVELKATGRSMQTSVSLMPSEFARALERGNDYILALVHDCEKGRDTKIKLVFDPARRASYRQTEAVRLSGLQNAAGLIVHLSDDGQISSSEQKGAPSEGE